MKILTIMSVKSSINKVSSIRVLFFIFPIFTKIECWPIFKQDPSGGQGLKILGHAHLFGNNLISLEPYKGAKKEGARLQPGYFIRATTHFNIFHKTFGILVKCTFKRYDWK